jgi:uncharacterized protein (PEP-CTERM system associated)
MFGGLQFSIEGGYETASYIGQDRTDNYFVVRPGLSYSFATWGSAGVSYEYRRNDSNRADSEFRNNLVMVEVGFRY